MSGERTILGLETEYAVSGTRASGEPLGPGAVSSALLHRLKRKHVDFLPMSAGAEGGFFAFTGGRIYVDSGHLEACTGEVNTPRELSIQNLAIDQAVAEAAQCVTEEENIRITVTKSNVDYSNGKTWGSHFNIHTRGRFARDDAGSAHHLLGFIASRVLFGVGGFDAGCGAFVLCPRSLKITSEISDDSTGGRRPLFHTRGRSDPLSRKGSRVHDIALGALINPVANHLRFGATALITCLIDRGATPDGAVELRKPVRALHLWTRDLSLSKKARSANGKNYTALEIQRTYLEFCEKHLDIAPPFARDILPLWAETLDLLESDRGRALDPALIGRLDWPRKLMTFRRCLERSGRTLSSFVRELKDSSSSVAQTETKSPVEVRLESFLGYPSSASDGGAGLPETAGEVRRLRDTLFLLDVKYSDIARPGWGQIDCSAVAELGITKAMIASVLDGSAVNRLRSRARIRAHHIRMSRSNGKPAANGKPVADAANWSHLLDNVREFLLPLDDPLEWRIRGPRAPVWEEPTDEESPFGSSPLLLRSPQMRIQRTISRALTLYDAGDLDDAYELFTALESNPTMLRHVRRQSDFFSQFSWVAARRGCAAQARNLVIQRWGPPPEDGGDPPGSMRQILEWTLILRHRALGVINAHPELGRWLERGEQLLAGEGAAEEISAFRRASFLGHVAMWRAFVESRVDVADTLHREARSLAEGTPLHSFPRARMTLDGARLAILRGEFDAADSLLDRGEQLCAENGFEGEQALVLLLQAQSAYARRRAGGSGNGDGDGAGTNLALARLHQAREILERKPNTVTMAKLAAAIARISGPQPSSSESSRRLFLACVNARDALGDCPLARRILNHWSEWTDGFSSAETSGIDLDWWGL